MAADFAHGPFWLGCLAAFIFLGLAWFAYLLYQTQHPDWWPPWDEGLPQGMRMLNVFVPVAMILMLGLIHGTRVPEGTSEGRRTAGADGA